MGNFFKELNQPSEIGSTFFEKHLDSYEWALLAYVLSALLLLAADGYNYWWALDTQAEIASSGWVPVYGPESTLLTVVLITGWFGRPIAFLCAMMYAQRCAEAIGITGYRWSLRWTVISMYVPFLNFVRPWLGFGEIRRSIIRSTNRIADDQAWRTVSFSPATLLLGIIFMTSQFIEGMAYKVITDFLPDFRNADVSLSNTILSARIGIASELICLAYVGWYLFSLRAPLRNLAGLDAVADTRGAQPRSAAGFQPIQTPATSDSNYDEIYELIARELAENNINQGLWTRLFAEAGGDENKTKALYIKRRAEILKEERTRSTSADSVKHPTDVHPKTTDPVVESDKGKNNLLWVLGGIGAFVIILFSLNHLITPSNKDQLPTLTSIFSNVPKSIPGLANARSAGYTDNEIAGYLSDTPTFGLEIKKAHAAGYADIEIYRYLGLNVSQEFITEGNNNPTKCAGFGRYIYGRNLEQYSDLELLIVLDCSKKFGDKSLF